MDRRRFLALAGIGGAAGVLGANQVRSKPAPQEHPDVEEVPQPASGSQRIFWSVDTDEPAAALTFDDGPDPRFTPRILEILERYQVKATFMAMGYNAVKHAALLRDVVAAGHEVGGHGWVHRNLGDATASEVREEIEYGLRKIEEVAGVRVRTFRPPYGRFGEDAVRLLARGGRDLVIWSLSRGNLGWGDPHQVADHVVVQLRPGDIILMHDGIGRGTFSPSTPDARQLHRRRSVEVDALPRILSGARARGVQLETVSNLLERMRPVQLDA